MTIEKFKYIVDAIKEAFIFAWEHRHRGKNVAVITIWGTIAIALIGTYTWAVNVDSEGNWDWTISTTVLGWCEVVFFLIASITALFMLYIFNKGESANKKDISTIIQKEDETLQLLARLEGKESQVIKHLLPNLRDAIDMFKVATAYSYLADIKKEAIIYYRQDYELLATIEYYLGQCSRYMQGKDCKKHFKEAYRLMKKTGNDETEIIEAMVYASCISKDIKHAKQYSEEVKALDKCSIWTVIPDLLVTEDLSSAVKSIPQSVDARLALANVIMMGGGKEHDLGVDIHSYNYSGLESLTLDNFALWVMDMSVALTRFLQTFAIQQDIKRMCTKECRRLYELSDAYLKALKETELDNLLPDAEFIHALTGYIIDQDQKRIEIAKTTKVTENMKEVYYLGLAIMLSHANRVGEGLKLLHEYGEKAPSSVMNMRLLLAIPISDTEEMHNTFKDASNSQCSIPDHDLNLFLGIIRGGLNADILDYAANLNIENPLSKRAIVEYLHFLKGEEVDVKWIESNENELHPILTPYIACIYKDKIGLDRAIEKLKTCIDRRVLDLRTRLLVDFMAEDKSYRKDLYHLLQDLRHASKSDADYDSQLMVMELRLSERIPDFKNNIELTEMMMQSMPENDSVVVHHLMAHAGLGCKNEIFKSYENRLLHSNLSANEIITVVNIYQSVGEDVFALEYLYQQIKRTNDQLLKDCYVSKHMNPAFDSLISVEKNIVEITDIVRIEIDGTEKEVEIASGSIYDVLVGKKCGEECNVNLREDVKVKIVSIRNKYYKLIRDIFDELKQTNSSKSIRMFSTEDFDFENDPLGALAKMAGRTEDFIAEEQKALKQYKHGEVPLTAFIKCPGSFADIYNKMYGDFMVCTYPTSQMGKAFTNARLNISDFDVVLDITSLIAIHEFDVKFGLSYEKKFYITNGLENFLKAEILNEEKGSISFFSASLKDKILVRELDKTRSTIWNKLKMLESWIAEHCEVIVVEEKLNLDLEKDFNTLASLSLESLLLAQRGYIMLSEDWSSVTHYIKLVPSMSVYNWLSLTSNSHSQEYAHFMLSCGNVGYDMTAEYIAQEYDKLSRGNDNSFKTCVENILYLPESPEIVLGASKLILGGLISGAKRMAVTNMLAEMFKVLRQESARMLVYREFLSSKDDVYRQCLTDSMRIAYPIIMI